MTFTPAQARPNIGHWFKMLDRRLSGCAVVDPNGLVLWETAGPLLRYAAGQEPRVPLQLKLVPFSAQVPLSDCPSVEYTNWQVPVAPSGLK